MASYRDIGVFYFKPKKLIAEAKLIAEKYAEGQIVEGSGKFKKKLDKLMRKIRKLENSSEEIATFSSKLRRFEARLLLATFPNTEETDETNEKCASLLVQSDYDVIAKKIWELFQRDFTNKFILEVLSVRDDIVEYSGAEEELHSNLEEALTTESVHEQILNVINQLSGQLVERLKRLGINPESNLAHYVQTELIIENIHNETFINEEGLNEILLKLNAFDHGEMQRTMVNYIHRKEFDQYNKEIMNIGFKHFGTPDSKHHRWTFLTDEDLGKLKRWMMLANIEKVFANDKNLERFEYWRNYIPYMREAYLIEKSPIILMKFDGFAVVEFGRMGAAYFYHEEGFDKVIVPIKDSERYERINSKSGIESMFKHREVYVHPKTGAPLFINSLVHGKGWKRKFDMFMTKYMRGDFQEMRQSLWQF